MLAARLYGPMDMRVEEIPRPVISDDEILLRIECAALCGTDVRMYQNGYPGVDQDHPRTLGHEFGGIIEEIGKHVEGFSLGMHVALAPNIGCGICDRCVRGDGHICENYQAFGVTMDGAFAEYVKVPANAICQGNLTVVPEGVDAEEVALNEPLSCVYNGFVKCDIRPGDHVLIVGAGPIGIMHAKLALMAGAAKVFMNDLSAARLAESKAIESRIITYHGNDLKGFIMKETGGSGLNAAVTACPAPAVQSAVIDLMAIGGRVLFFGGLPKDKEIVPINTNTIHYRELTVTGSTRANNEQFRKTLGFIADGILEVKSLVTARFPISEMDKALTRAIQAEGFKNIITF